MSKYRSEKNIPPSMTDNEIEQLAKDWKAPIVARTVVGEFSGGILHPRTMANIDSRGDGPEKRLALGRVVYPTMALVDWMKARAKKG